MYRKTICVLLICALLMGNFLATPVSANASSPEVEVYYAWWSIYELNLSCSKEESSETKTATTWNHGVELERRAIDGDISTYWESAEMQSVSEAYTTAYLLNLGSAQSISGIAINTGSQMWNYLDTYEVYAWTDGQEALLVAKGSA